ncbi:hypothetical protein [Pseudodesulfovibrio sediminis]|uniref:hypothetical protein n=1 Tax=Pseudodesulfovibrio sediminis TaxID=2810563 RepID=UPI001E412997|nr:hypothetical protein [Pseudodesulfovibrio sediminis]
MGDDDMSMKDKLKVLSDLWTRSQQRYVSLVSLYSVLNMAWIGLFVFLRADHVSALYYVCWWFFSLVLCGQMAVALGAAREEGGYFGWALQALEVECCNQEAESDDSYGFYGCDGQYITTRKFIGGLALLQKIKRGCGIYHPESGMKFTKCVWLTLRNKWFFPRLASAPFFFAILHTVILFYAFNHECAVKSGIEVIIN